MKRKQLYLALFMITMLLLYVSTRPIRAAGKEELTEGTREQERRVFAATAPCPSNGAIHSPECPGYVIDHVVPLCAGGQDDARNMQWQSTFQAKKKNLRERAYCSCLKRSGNDKSRCRL